jgi:hypothetical protein
VPSTTFYVGFGVLAIAALILARARLTGSQSASSDHVRNERSPQHIIFPTAARLSAEGRVMCS